MPMNHGQSRPSTRWYKLCFIPTIGDSSDDSDTESVVIAPGTPTQSSTRQQPSPSHPPQNLPSFTQLILPRRYTQPPPPPPPSPPPPNLEPEITLYSPQPSPPSTFFTPSSPFVPLQFETANRQPQFNLQSSQPPPPPPQNPEPQLNWRYPPPPPPPPFSSVSEPQINLHSSQSPSPSPPSPIPQDSWNYFSSPVDNVSPSVITHGRTNDNQSEFLRIPDSVMNLVHIVRISELHLIDELSQCPICMEEFKLGDQACRLPCNHTYKFDCILRWLNNSKSCPVCRLQLDGFEGQGSSYNIRDIDDNDDNDDDSLDLEPQIPPLVINSWDEFFQFSPNSQVIEDSAGDNSDEAEYDSACDDLGNSHEDGERVDW